MFISTVLSSVDSLPGRAARAAAATAAAARRARSITAATAASGNGGGANKGEGEEEEQGEEGDEDASVVGLWAHPRRFNVAVTRSRALLVVVGHPAVLRADAYWRELVRQCVARWVQALVTWILPMANGEGRIGLGWNWGGTWPSGGRASVLCVRVGVGGSRALWVSHVDSSATVRGKVGAGAGLVQAGSCGFRV